MSAEHHFAVALAHHDRLEQVAAGRSNRQAAAALQLSVRTVEHHLRSSYRKLGVASRTEMALRLARAGS